MPESRFYICTRKESVPISTFAFNCDNLNLSFDRSMELDFYLSNLREPETVSSGEMESLVLRPRQTVISIFVFEARISWDLLEFYTAKETLERKINPTECLLKNLRVDLNVLRAKCFDLRELSALVVKPDRNTALPSFPAFFCGGIMEFPAEVKPIFKYIDLSLCRIDAILEVALESSYNLFSHDALCLIQGRLGQKPKAVSAVFGFGYYDGLSTKNP